VLTLTIPVHNEPEDKVFHNLPIPDFDETGFIGRKKDVDDIKRLVLSTKVVSIIGDGGIGKTALALKVAYDILDMGEKCPFDMIIWTSAKTTMLTVKGIEEINNSIKDFIGLIDFLNDAVGNSRKSPGEQIEEILENLSVFRTLLIIDNLETIQTEEVRDFIREAQMKCNIIITSRIGLGELEFPRKLDGLKETEASQLIREIARIRNSEYLMKLPQETLVDICSKLYFNPLALKWFVNTVQSGIQPIEILNNKGDLLNFCMSNVYEKLSQGAIQILNTIRAARKNLNTAEIIFLSEQQPIEVRKNLNELFTTTLIARELTNKSTIDELNYFLTDFAKDFLSKHVPLDATVVKSILSKLKQLTQSIAQLNKTGEHNEFDINAITYRNHNEKIAAKFLTEALRFSKAEDYPSALNKVDEAKGIVPYYFECYRVGAFIKGIKGDILGAEEDYQTGLEMEPDNPRLLYYYSQLLLFQMGDTDAAFELAKQVYQARPTHSYTAFLLSRCLGYLGKFQEAIKIIEDIKETNLNTKERRISSTELIGFHHNQGKYLIEVENDYQKGIEEYRASLNIFETLAEVRNLDARVIKNFCNALYSFLSVVSPLTKDAELENYLRNTIQKYATLIETTTMSEKIILKFNDKFEKKIGSEETDVNTNNKLFGNITARLDFSKPFVFISTYTSRYYANKSEFVDINSWDDWEKLEEHTKVSFELGENHLGVCAVKIQIITD
jgi:tetratricopeptide (TPR) repeat protein